MCALLNYIACLVTYFNEVACGDLSYSMAYYCDEDQSFVYSYSYSYSFFKTTTLVHSFSHSYGHATFPPTLKFSSGESSHSYSYSLCFDDCNENCFKYHLGNCAQSCDEETKMWIEDICGQNSFPCAASCGEEDDPCSSDCYSGCPGE